jgi:hypothetical protein
MYRVDEGNSSSVATTGQPELYFFGTERSTLRGSAKAGAVFVLRRMTWRSAATAMSPGPAFR